MDAMKNQRIAAGLVTEITRFRAMEDYGGQVQERTRDLVDIIGAWTDDVPARLVYRARSGSVVPDFEAAMKSYL